jgi:hyperosmotically inducible protein
MPLPWAGAAGGRITLNIDGKIRAELIGDREISSTNIDVKAIQCHVVLLGIVGSKKEIAKPLPTQKA